MIKNYFAGANSCQGFYSFYEYLPFDCERTFIIKGGPGTGKSTFMKRIAVDMIKKGYKIEKHWCSSDSESLDGLVIKDLKVAFLDGTAPHLVDPDYPGVIGEILNFGRYWDRELLLNEKEEIIELTQANREYFNKTYQQLKLANSFFRQIDDFYKKNYDANKLNNQFINYFKELLKKKNAKQKARHLFSAALTPAGIIDYTAEILASSKKVILVKDEGSNGSDLLKKAGILAENYGYQITYFHSFFIPQLIDVLVIDELGIVILRDKNNISLSSIKLLKIFNLARQIKFDKKINDKVILLKKKKEKKFKKAIAHLKKAKEIHDQLEEKYIKAMNFDQLEAKRQSLLAEITK